MKLIRENAEWGTLKRSELLNYFGLMSFKVRRRLINIQMKSSRCGSREEGNNLVEEKKIANQIEKKRTAKE